MEKTEEAAAEAKTKRGGGFHFEGERRVVQRELFNRIAQVFEFRTVDREETTENHRD